MNYSEFRLYRQPPGFYSNSQNSIRSQYSSPDPLYDNCDTPKQDDISNLVETIISDKFKGTIGRIKQRSLERRKCRTKYYDDDDTYGEKFGYQNGSDDSGLNTSSFEDFSSENTSRSPDQHGKDLFRSSRFSLRTLNPKTTDASFDIMVNTRTLPSKYYANRLFTNSVDYSVGSSNISSLISTQCPSSFVNVSKSDQQLTKPQQIAQSIYNESISVKRHDENNRRDELLKNIIYQLETMLQISKALNFYYNRNSSLVDSGVAAEKILLLAGLKKSALEKYIQDEHYEQVDDLRIYSNVTVENLVFTSSCKIQQKNFKRYSWHFVCVAIMGPTVASSDVIYDEENGVLKCEKEFHFTKSNEHAINLALYAMPVRVKKDKSCLKLRSSETPKNINAQDVLRESLFKLWGSTTINILRFKQKYFQLSYVCDDAAILDYFTADIENAQEINVDYRGFLTVGRIHLGYPILDTRWCFLQGFHLKYWNYPNEELVCEPLRVLDLRQCTRLEINKQEYSFPNRKNIYLQFNNVSGSGTVEYYLFADNEEDFKRWERTLNSVYSAMKKDFYIF